MDGTGLQAVVFWLSKKKKKGKEASLDLLLDLLLPPRSISSYQQLTYKILKGFPVASCKFIATGTSWLQCTSKGLSYPQMRPPSTALNAWVVGAQAGGAEMRVRVALEVGVGILPTLRLPLCFPQSHWLPLPTVSLHHLLVPSHAFLLPEAPSAPSLFLSDSWSC